jgi:hypothetical protein
MKAQWISLKPEEIDSKEQAAGKAGKGVHLELSLSPYDIPERVRGYYNEELKRFVIEFRYINDEPLVERKLSDHVIVKEGKNSGRLYDVLVDVDAMNVDLITAAITEARHARSVGGETKRERLNSRLFDAVQERLMPALAGKA